MAEHRVYRLKLSPEKVLERLRSSGRSVQSSAPYEISVAGSRFFMDSGSLGPSLSGSVVEEEGGSCIDLRLSLNLVPTLSVIAFGLLAAQLAVSTSMLNRGPLIDLKVRGEEKLQAIGLVAIAALLLCLDWRRRRRLARDFWTFFDRLFADVKLGEEQL